MRTARLLGLELLWCPWRQVTVRPQLIWLRSTLVFSSADSQKLELTGEGGSSWERRWGCHVDWCHVDGQLMDVSSPVLIWISWINSLVFVVTVGGGTVEKRTRRSRQSVFLHLTLTAAGSALPLMLQSQPCNLNWVSMAMRRRGAEVAGGGLQKHQLRHQSACLYALVVPLWSNCTIGPAKFWLAGEDVTMATVSGSEVSRAPQLSDWSRRISGWWRLRPGLLTRLCCLQLQWKQPQSSQLLW